MGWLSSGIATILFAGAIFGIAVLIKNRLAAAISLEVSTKLEEIKKQNSIDLAAIGTEYSRQLKDYEEQLKLRNDSRKIVDLLIYLSKGQVDVHEFNHMAWELSLILPADVVCSMAEVLINKNGTMLDLLIAVRKHLLGKEDKLAANNLLNAQQILVQEPATQAATAPAQA